MNYLMESHQTSSINEFTDDEIREQLEYLGFKNVSKDKFNQFKNDLEKLIAQEVSINSTSSYYDFDRSKNDLDINSNASRKSSSITPTRFLNKEFNNEKMLKNKKVTFPDESHLVVKTDEQEDIDQSFASIVTTSSIVDNKIFKRKIIRKSNNNDSNLLLNMDNLKKAITENELELDLNENNEYEHNSDFDEEYDEQLEKLKEFYPPVTYPVKSFIRSQSSLSTRSDSSRVHTRSNPVQKFQEYSKMWSRQKVPGEKKHSDLRWSIREQMLSKDVIIKRQPKTYEPNMYKIPTDKKRQQLRWAVRSALANQF